MAVFSPAARQSSKQQFPANSLVILDPAISDLALLRSGILPTATVHILDAQRDGITQITELLQGAAYEAIHLVSHGAPGCLYLGNTELSLSTFDQYALQLKTWDLAETDLLLYGCNLAAGDAGEEFLIKLHQLTGAKLHAAAHPVGNPNCGGTWMLMPQQLGDDAPAEKHLPLAFEDFILSRYTGLFAPGELDTSFSNDGLVVTDFNQGTDIAEAVMTDDQGRILVAGTASGSGGTKYFAVTRYDANGALDTSFGNGGRATTTFYGGADTARDMLIDRSGRIVVAGRVANANTSTNGSYDLGLIRYTANGVLDSSFGASGKAKVDVANGNDEGWAIALDSNDNLLIAGGTNGSNSSSDISLVRLTEAGIVDIANFGTGGQVTTDINGRADAAYAMAIDSQGRIILASRSSSSDSAYNFALTRYSASGVLDTAFGNNGIVITDFNGRNDYPHGITVDSQDNILVVGRTSVVSQGDDVALVRYSSSDGAIDASFGDNGQVLLDLSGRSDAGYDLQLDAAGNIVVTGRADGQLALLRLQANGEPDVSFGAGGRSLLDVSSSIDLGNDVTFDDQGRILVAGSTRYFPNAGTDFLLARFDISPAPPTLDVVSVTPSPNAVVAQAGSSWQITFAEEALPSTVSGDSIRVRGSQSGWFDAEIIGGGSVFTVTLPAGDRFLPGEQIEILVTSALTNQNDEAAANTVLRFRAEVEAETNATFQHVQAFGDRFNTQEAALGDFDGDGDLDAALAQVNEPTELWLNDGNGRFSQSSFDFLGLDLNSQGITAGDVNSDGLLDIVVANNRDSNELWLNQGDGSFTPTLFGHSSEENQVVRLGDLNGDGHLDILATGIRAGQVFHNDGFGQFTQVQDLPSAQWNWETRLGDFDGDGDLDAFLAGSAYPQEDQNQLWLNNGQGYFYDSGQRLGESLSLGLDVGDLDGDGDLDAYVANRLQPDRVWLNDGQGNFTDSGQLLSEAEVHGVSLGDFDGDGDLDAFVNNFGANEIWLNDGNAQFTLAQHDLGNALGNEVALGDLDGDGDLDALATNKDGPNQVLLNEDDLGVTEVSLAAIAEDSSPSPSQSINDLMQPVLASQGEGASLSYVAVVENAPMGEGFWQFASNGLEDWASIPRNLAETDAWLIAADDRLRFLPAADFNGPAPALKLRTIDDSYELPLTDSIDVSQNGWGTAIAAELTTVGVEVTAVNDAPQLLTQESIWVSTDNRLEKYSLTGQLLSTTTIPEATENGYEQARDLVQDRLGDIQVYNGTFAPILSTYLVDEQQWYDRTFDGWSTVNNGSYGGIATVGNYVFASDMSTGQGGGAEGIVRFGPTGTERFADTDEFIDLTLGLDNKLYALTAYDDVFVYEPQTMALERAFRLSGFKDYRAIAANANGEIFSAAWDGKVYHFDAAGALLNSVASGENDLLDIDITSNGKLLIGSRFGEVLVTDQSLASFASFSTGDDNVFVAVAETWRSLTPVSDHAIAPVGAVGSLVSALVNTTENSATSGNVLDSDGPEIGIALTAADSANGNWFYSLDAGATWLELPQVDEAAALLLAADEQTRLYFQPTPGFHGELDQAIQFRAWDRSDGEAGSLADVSANGGATAFSETVGQASLSVLVLNDAPTVEDQQFTIAEDADPDAVVGVVPATDPETPDDLQFSIVGGNEAGQFSIDNQGRITLNSNAALDYDQQASYQLNVVVTDQAGEDSLSDEAIVNIDISEVRRARNDFNGDGYSDIVLRNFRTGTHLIRYMRGTEILRDGVIGRDIPDPSWEIERSGDFDNDGQEDLLLRHYSTGTHLIWFMDGVDIRSEQLIGRPVNDPNWAIEGTGDFNNDGQMDMLLRNDSADQNLVWSMNGTEIIAEGLIGRGIPDAAWNIEATADFDNDGQTDILLRHYRSGQNLLWTMDGHEIKSERLIGRVVEDLDWRIEGAGDFNGDGQADIFMRHYRTGDNLMWLMNDGQIDQEILVNAIPDTAWRAVV